MFEGDYSTHLADLTFRLIAANPGSASVDTQTGEIVEAEQLRLVHWMSAFAPIAIKRAS
jgi:hypothetical protein